MTSNITIKTVVLDDHCAVGGDVRSYAVAVRITIRIVKAVGSVAIPTCGG